MTGNILALPLKFSKPLGGHLTQAIRKYIAEHYTDTHPDAHKEDIADFVRLRDECCRLEAHTSCLEAAFR